VIPWAAADGAVLGVAEADPIVPVENAFYTKSLLPEAELRTFEGLGHLSIGPRTMEAAGDLAAQVPPILELSRRSLAIVFRRAAILCARL